MASKNPASKTKNPAGSQRKLKAKQIYEGRGLEPSKIAEILKLNVKTVTGWIEKEGWVKGLTEEDVAAGKEFARTSFEIVKEGSTKNKLILEMAQPTLELAFFNLHAKLTQERNSQEFSSIRDYAGLIGKLMETIGKITGETTGDLEKTEVEIKRQTLGVLSDIAKRIEEKGVKKITASSDNFDLEKYQVKVIDG